MSFITQNIPEGAIRFNTDSSKMELWNGQKWMIVSTSSPNLGNSNAGVRGIFAGGWRNSPSTARSNGIDFITISSTGDATDFGDLSRRASYVGTCSSKTRGVIAGGNSDNSSSASNIIDFITISSTGDSQDFGDLPAALNAHYGHSNEVRGVFATGYNPSPSFSSKDDISVLTIASTGNAEDGGDLSRHQVQSFVFGNGVRGIWGGGYYQSSDGSAGFASAGEKHILVNIGSLGEVTTFGDFRGASADGSLIRSSGMSNSTRGIRFSGYTSPYHLTYDKYEIASLGNAVTFGDPLYSREWPSCTSSATRGVAAGGDPSNYQTYREIQYFEIATGGTALDFGDLTDRPSSSVPQGISNGHGGL